MTNDLRRQIVIAAFDTAASLRIALDALTSQGMDLRSAAVLTAREIASFVSMRESEIAKPARVPVEFVFRLLPFTPHVHCSVGTLASALEKLRAEGVMDLAGALKTWLEPKRADELAYQLEHGRILLWFEILEPEHYNTVCAQLVRASPHIVEICATCH